MSASRFRPRRQAQRPDQTGTRPRLKMRCNCPQYREGVHLSTIPSSPGHLAISPFQVDGVQLVRHNCTTELLLRPPGSSCMIIVAMSEEEVFDLGGGNSALLYVEGKPIVALPVPASIRAACLSKTIRYMAASSTAVKLPPPTCQTSSVILIRPISRLDTSDCHTNRWCQKSTQGTYTMNHVVGYRGREETCILWTRAES